MGPQQQQQQQQGDTPRPKMPRPVSETRRIRKPLMERKRRERINTSLNDLASLLTEARLVKSEGGGRPAKLEKADILELTVKHILRLKGRSEVAREGSRGSKDTTIKGGLSKDTSEFPSSSSPGVASFVSFEGESNENSTLVTPSASHAPGGSKVVMALQDTPSTSKASQDPPATPGVSQGIPTSSPTTKDTLTAKETPSAAPTPSGATQRPFTAPADSHDTSSTPIALKDTPTPVDTLNDTTTSDENYKRGFLQCMSALDTALHQPQDSPLRQRILKHLQDFLGTVEGAGKDHETANAPQGKMESAGPSVIPKPEPPDKSPTEGDVSRITLVPTRLPGGTLAFVVQGDSTVLRQASWEGSPKGFSKNVKNENWIPSVTLSDSSPPSSTAVPSTAVPSTAVPSKTVPSDTVPSKTLLSTTVPSTTVPSTTVPSTITVPATTIPILTPTTSVLLSPTVVPPTTMALKIVLPTTVPSTALPPTTVSLKAASSTITVSTAKVSSITVPSAATVPPATIPATTVLSTTTVPSTAVLLPSAVQIPIPIESSSEDTKKNIAATTETEASVTATSETPTSSRPRNPCSIGFSPPVNPPEASRDKSSEPLRLATSPEASLNPRMQTEALKLRISQSLNYRTSVGPKPPLPPPTPPIYATPISSRTQRRTPGSEGLLIDPSVRPFTGNILSPPLTPRESYITTTSYEAITPSPPLPPPPHPHHSATPPPHQSSSRLPHLKTSGVYHPLPVLNTPTGVSGLTYTPIHTPSPSRCPGPYPITSVINLYPLPPTPPTPPAPPPLHLAPPPPPIFLHPHQEPSGGKLVEEEVDRRRGEAVDEMDVMLVDEDVEGVDEMPYDLSLRRMWRPW